MGWQLYRGKQAKAPAGCSFLDSENEWEKVKLCFEMINRLTSMLFGESDLTIGLITSI